MALGIPRHRAQLRYLRRQWTARSLLSASVAASPRSRCSRFDAAGVPRVARSRSTAPARGRRGAVRAPTPTACRHPGAGTSRTGAPRESRLWADRRPVTTPATAAASAARARDRARPPLPFDQPRAHAGPAVPAAVARPRPAPVVAKSDRPRRRSRPRGRPTTDRASTSSACSTPARRCSRARSRPRATTTTTDAGRDRRRRRGCTPATATGAGRRLALALDVGAVEREAHLARRVRHARGVVAGHEPVAVEVHEALVERLHAVEVAVGHLVLELGEPRRIGDPLAHPRVHDEHLDRGDAAPAAGTRQQALRHDAAQRRRERRARLALAVRREHLDEAVDGVDRAHRRHARRARGARSRPPGAAPTRRRRRGARPSMMHVGVLAQRVLEAGDRARRVGADLALVDDRPLVGVQHLDRVLDRDDVALAVRVDVVDHRRQRRGLARAGEAGDEHEPVRLRSASVATAVGQRRARRSWGCPAAPGAARARSSPVDGTRSPGTDRARRCRT